VIRQQFGLEASKAVLRHTDTKITEVSAERDLELATRIMWEIGEGVCLVWKSVPVSWKRFDQDGATLIPPPYDCLAPMAQ
jgi:hypothetical protein